MKITLSIFVTLLSLSGHCHFKSNWENGLPLNSKTLAVPANDECAAAYVVPVNTDDQYTLGQSATFVGATVSTEGGTSCGTANSGDIWFQFTAANSAQTVDLINFTGTPHPIALTFYSGQCGGLNQLYCSSNNSVTATNLTIGTTYFVRASIATTTTDLNVQFKLCIRTPAALASGGSTNCLVTTVNADFEMPVISGSNMIFPKDNTILGWKTTATDHVIEFWPEPNYEGHKAYSGKQFIELNAFQASAVYQDYTSPVTRVFNFGFAHKGRQGTDVCGLYAGPPEGPYTLIQTATTGKTAWKYYTGSYTVPAGQGVTRFIFKAISSSTGDQSVGNFLDAINFTAENGIFSTTITSNSGVLSVAEAAAAYKWMTCKNGTYELIPNQTDRTYAPTQSGSYAVEVSRNVCWAMSSCFEFAVLGTAHYNLQEDVKLFPNPTNGNITIEATSLENAHLNVFDITGRFIFSKELKAESPLNISNLPAGVYMFRISNDSGTITKRVIKN